ncbi:MAG TPA: hypothetical protein VMT71_00135 [Syntrophorhabdales bacterium]|nr:hypothetical protein [Syntrophorhabdales bacterium]
MVETNSHRKRDLIGSMRLDGAFILLMGIAFLMYSALALATDSAPRVLGTTVALGKASMKAGNVDRWIPVDEKTYPITDGTVLKTEDGTMSVTMKDRASFELGKKTELVVNGVTGNYSMRLQLGTVAFRIYEGMGLFVATPSTSVVVQRVPGMVENVRQTAKSEISGIITHDGKETQVICQRGKFGVMRAAAETLILTEGSTTVVQDATAVTQSAQTTGTTTQAATQQASSPKIVFYESPNALQNTNANTNTILLQNVETGGTEVSSENTP